MSAEDIEWIPGDRRVILANQVLALAGVAAAFAALIESVVIGVGSIHPSLAQILGSSVVILGVLFAGLGLNLYSRKRPGRHDIGVSSRGLSIRAPLQTLTFQWSELIWYNDRTLMEVRSSWWTAVLVPLTPRQYDGVRRWLSPPPSPLPRGVRRD